MADTKDKEPDLGEHTVHVTVTPKEGETRTQDRQNKEDAAKIKDRVKEQVKDEIAKRKGQGNRKQLDVVDDVADKVKKGVPSRTVKDVDIKVDGKTEDGDDVSRRRKVAPKE